MASKILVLLALGLVSQSAFATPPFQLQDYEGIYKPFEVSQNLVPGNRASNYDTRLPGDLRPSQYWITISPRFPNDPEGIDEYTIPGSVRIQFKCLKTTSTIVLHGVDITIKSSILTHIDLDETPIEIKTPVHDGGDMFMIDLADPAVPLTVGQEYVLTLEYVARVSDGLSGMYRSRYSDPKSGEITELFATQFQSTGARRVFPSFDEPGYKATFRISVQAEKSRHVLSNMVEENIVTDENYKMYIYPVTPVMSSYLLAFVISDFTSVSADPAATRVPLKVWGPKPYMDAKGGEHAVDAKTRIVKYFEEMTDFPYELPKLDSAAIPDFAAGAMENWGLNTYRIEYLMYIPGETTEAMRKQISQVLAHEIAHQWFGNVITCDWWNETWLNEGFASFMQYRGLQAANPEVADGGNIVSDGLQRAMITDQGPGSHAVYIDYTGYNSRIFYDKVASLIRTFETALSEPVFDAVIKEYLKTYNHQSVVADDLWTAFEKAAVATLPNKMTMKQFAQPWFSFAGYPILRASVTGPNKITFTQAKFTPQDGTTSTVEVTEAAYWHIPVTAVSESKPALGARTPAFWLLANQPLTTRSEFNTSEWNVFNPEASGYYRVLYDEPLLAKIKAQLDTNHTVFTAATRSQILEDYFQFAEAKYVPIERALELTEYLGKETDLTVWTPIIPHLKAYIRGVNWNAADVTAFKNYFLPKISQVLDTIGYHQNATERGKHVILRAQLFDLALALNDDRTKTYALGLFNQWIQNPSNAVNRAVIPVDLRPMVLCAGLQSANQTIWDTVFEQWESEYYFWVKSVFLRSLSCSNDETTLWQYLQKSKDSNSGLSYLATLQAIAESTVGTELLFFISMQELEAKPTEESGKFFADVMSVLSPYWSDVLWLNEAVNLYNLHKEVVPESINGSFEVAHKSLSWYHAFARPMINWLTAH